jgi:hypothetical protein
MANVLYTPAKTALLSAAFNLSSDTIKAILVDSATYTFSAAHQFLSDVPAQSIISTATLASKTVTGGVFDAADIVFTSVAAGAALEYVILYKDTGVAGTSALLCFIDTATGLPVTPTGSNINVAWSNGSNKIFALT